MSWGRWAIFQILLALDVILLKIHRDPLCKRHKQVASQDEAGLELWNPVSTLSHFLASGMSSGENNSKITKLDNPAVIQKEPIKIHMLAERASLSSRTSLSPGTAEPESASCVFESQHLSVTHLHVWRWTDIMGKNSWASYHSQE